MKLWILAWLLLIAVPAAALEPGKYDLSIRAGEDFTTTWRINTCSAYSATGACIGIKIPMDLSGYLFAAQFRTSYDSSPLLADFAITTVPTQGRVTIFLPRSSSRRLANKAGLWDLRITAPDGSTSYLLKGSCKVVPSITK